MEIKKLFGSGSVFFGVAALLLISFLSNIYIFLTDKSMLKTGDGWAIMFWAISFASALMLGIMDKRGSLCKASCVNLQIN